MKLSKTSIALLLIQLAIVSTIAAKYLYQRWTCPRVWVRTVAVDPELPMRGRYLSLRLVVDGCGSTLPSAKAAQFRRDINGAAVQGPYTVQAPARFQAELKVDHNRLTAVYLREDENRTLGQEVSVWPGAACDAMRLDTPVDFYLPEHATDLSRLKPGQELWIEVTVPPKGPPRPIQLALKDNSAWKPLAMQ
jgi:uncharacterized membrane-anchored protein